MSGTIDTATFLDLRFARKEAHEHIELRTFGPGGQPGPRSWHTDPTQAAQTAATLPEALALYYGVSLRRKGGGTKADVTSVHDLWGDIDDKRFGDGRAGAESALDAFPLPPTLLVDSGGGLHPYWQLRAPLRLDGRNDPLVARIESLLQRLYLSLGVDAVQDVSRVLRLPGSLNTKHQPPRPVRVLLHDPAAIYTLEDFEALLPPPPRATRTRARTTTARRDGDPSPEEVRELLRFIPAGGGYTEDWLRILGAVHSVYPGSEGVALCEEWCPGKTGEIARKFASFKRDPTANDATGVGTLFYLAKQHGWRPKPGTYVHWEGDRDDTVAQDDHAPEHEPAQAEDDPEAETSTGGARGDDEATEALGPYRMTERGIMWLRETRDGQVLTPLTNFPARIIGNIAEDDGAEVRRVLEVEAKLKGRTRTERLTPDRFAAMGWHIDLLGPGAIVYPGQNTKENARTAIQLLSGDMEEQIVYAHLGWREHAGAMVYLHGGGAIGADGPVPGVQVDPPGDLARFVLPDPLDGDALKAALKEGRNFIPVAPEAITLPLLMCVFRAALGGADFSLFLVGPTGAGKSELAALAQQHFGVALDARHLPASWSSTANALEGICFAAKDTLLTIDDFAPGGSQADVQRMHRDADRILRGQGNHAGRQRMTADARLRQGKPSRCLPLITGEDVAKGQSAQARALILEVGPQDVRKDLLGVRQRAAADGTYAATLASFVRWIAPQYDAIQVRLAAETLRLRDDAVTSTAHSRTPGIVASLAAGWRIFLDFSVAVGALSPKNADWTWQRGWDALGQALAAQAQHQAASEPTARFIDLLNSALASNEAHIADATGKAPAACEAHSGPKAWGWQLRTIFSGPDENHEWQAKGRRVGWVDGPDLYLDRDAALAVAARIGQAVGDSITITTTVLTKRLAERGHLVSTDTARGTNYIRRTLEGKQRKVLHLATATLAPKEEEEPSLAPAHDADRAA